MELLQCFGGPRESFESLGARARLVTSLGARRWSTAVGRGLGVLAASLLATVLSDQAEQACAPGAQRHLRAQWYQQAK